MPTFQHKLYKAETSAEALKLLNVQCLIVNCNNPEFNDAVRNKVIVSRWPMNYTLNAFSFPCRYSTQVKQSRIINLCQVC